MGLFMATFIGRKKELAELGQLLEKKSANLVVIKGRRRIGKSRLAGEFAKSFSQSCFFSGLPPTQGVGAAAQRAEFIRQMNEQKIPRLMGEDWGDLFRDLAQKYSRGKCLIVLDEISWMGMKDPTFLGKLKIAWDQHFSQNSQLMLILSGSQSTWIEKNILNSSGFVGRISYTLTLEELSLSECAEFWGAKKKWVSAYEKLKFLSVTGGVPRYLEELQPQHSSEENILRLCFKKEGFLFHEFEQIFSDLFSKRSAKYQQIVTRLAEGPCLMEEIVRFMGRHRKGHGKGGDISEALEDLCKTGFVSRDFTWDVKTAQISKLSQYRLSDNYVRFYLKAIEPRKVRIKSGLSSLPPAWLSLLGFQFENLVLSPNNRFRIYELLHIPHDEILWANPYFQTKTLQRKACQIDFMIQTKHNTLYLCEIKFKKEQIGTDVITEVQRKIADLKIPKNFSIRPVLIQVNGVENSIVEADFFSCIIEGTSLFAI